LLDVLARHHVRATFFLLGKNIERDRATALRLVRSGHVAGNHTYSHARPDAIAQAILVAELARTDTLLEALYREAAVPSPGAPFPVRLPYGPAPDDPRLRALASVGRTHVHWTGDFEDWADPQPLPADLAAAMRAHVEAQHAQGLDAVLDLHDSSRLYADRSVTVAAVDLLLAAARWDTFTVPA
jgi:chitin deacetylase